MSDHHIMDQTQKSNRKQEDDLNNNYQIYLHTQRVKKQVEVNITQNQNMSLKGKPGRPSNKPKRKLPEYKRGAQAEPKTSTC